MRLKEITSVFITFSRKLNCERTDKTKRFGLVIIEWRRSSMICLHSLFLAVNPLPLVGRVPFILLVQGGHLSHGRFISRFQGYKGGSECLFELAVSQISLIQNN